MAPSSSTTALSPAELSYLHTSLSSHPPIRPDARNPTDFRPLNAETAVLPNTMGSAHVGFADGREAVVGVRAEVEKTAATGSGERVHTSAQEGDVEMVTEGGKEDVTKPRGRVDWVTLGLTLPGMRDDDKDLVFLEEMLRETLVASPSASALSATRSVADRETQEQAQAQSLQDALVINYRWHWHLYIDVLLISAPDHATSSSTTSGSKSGSGLGSFPLPLLSMAIHLALRDTRLPKLKSEGDEDPVADDDWDASVHLYSRAGRTVGCLKPGLVPPVTLLVMVVAENVLFDPSATELAVADGVLAVSVGRVESGRDGDNSLAIFAVRTLETPARDTMKGVPRDDVEVALGSGTDQIVPGVWKPKVGGIKRAVFMKIVKAVVADGVGKEVLEGLDGFLGGA